MVSGRNCFGTWADSTLHLGVGTIRRTQAPAVPNDEAKWDPAAALARLQVDIRDANDWKGVWQGLCISPRVPDATKPLFAAVIVPNGLVARLGWGKEFRDRDGKALVVLMGSRPRQGRERENGQKAQD